MSDYTLIFSGCDITTFLYQDRKKDYFSFQFIKETAIEKREMPAHSLTNIKICQLENKAKINNDSLSLWHIT